MNSPPPAPSRCWRPPQTASLPPGLRLGREPVSGSDGVLGAGVFFFVILSLFSISVSGQCQITTDQWSSREWPTATTDPLTTAFNAPRGRCASSAQTPSVCGKLPVVSESIIRGLLHIGGRGAGQREVDDQRPGHNLLPRHKAPEAGILAVIAVVAQHEVLALGAPPVRRRA
jgi:hypothetical protein